LIKQQIGPKDQLTLSRPVTPNGVIVFKQWDMVKGVSKFTNKVNTNEEQ